MLAKHQHRPNKRIRRIAWDEVDNLLREGRSRDRSVIEGVTVTARQRVSETADLLYGAQKFGRDVTQPLIIPRYVRSPPLEPEHGFRLIYVDGMPMRLYYEGAWVKLSGDLLRQVSRSGLRVALADACAFQEQRHWITRAQVLWFRDWTMASTFTS